MERCLGLALKDFIFIAEQRRQSRTRVGIPVWALGNLYQQTLGIPIFYVLRESSSDRIVSVPELLHNIQCFPQDSEFQQMLTKSGCVLCTACPHLLVCPSVYLCMFIQGFCACLPVCMKSHLDFPVPYFYATYPALPFAARAPASEFIPLLHCIINWKEMYEWDGEFNIFFSAQYFVVVIVCLREDSLMSPLCLY